MVVQSRTIKFLEGIHIALQKNHVAEVEGVEVILQVMFGDLIIQLRLPVMNLADDLADGLSDAAALLFGEFGVEWCQREGQHHGERKAAFHWRYGDVFGVLGKPYPRKLFGGRCVFLG